MWPSAVCIIATIWLPKRCDGSIFKRIVRTSLEKCVYRSPSVGAIAYQCLRVVVEHSFSRQKTWDQSYSKFKNLVHSPRYRILARDRTRKRNRYCQLPLARAAPVRHCWLKAFGVITLFGEFALPALRKWPMIRPPPRSCTLQMLRRRLTARSPCSFCKAFLWPSLPDFVFTEAAY